MPWDGSGNFSRSYNWQNDEASAIDILSDRMDGEDDNFATGINACLTKNNESKPTATFSPNSTRSYDIGATSARWRTIYLGTGISVQSGTASAATTLDFTDATSARTVTFPDATGTLNLLEANQTVSGNKTHSGTITATNDVTMSAAPLWTAEGANVASASDCDIWAGGDGNTVHLTGTTTVTDWGTAPQAGAYMRVICDAATPLTYNATTNDMNTGGMDYTTTAGDILHVYARSTSSYKVTVQKYQPNITINTAVATTSGTSVSLSTSIPPWARRVTLCPYGVSTSGTSPLLIQLGDSGGFENTGYVSNVSVNGPSNVSAGTSSTAGFVMTNTQAAGSVWSGNVTLQLINAASFLWMQSGVTANLNDSGYVIHSAGYKATSAAMDRIQITTVGGTDTFDAGSITVIWE